MSAPHRTGVEQSARLSEDAELGEGVTIEAGATVVGRVRLLDHSVIGVGSVVEGPKVGRRITIGPSALIAAGAVVSICDVGRDAVVRPGSVVTRSVPDRAVVEGNPAHVVHIKPSARRPEHVHSETQPYPGDRPERIVHLTSVDDMRGSLMVGEVGDGIPFDVQRIFTISGVPGPEVRGEHAHVECHQLLVAVAGSLEVICDDGLGTAVYLLDAPDIGLHIPPMVWGIQHRYSSEAVLLVLASSRYDPADYIRDYADFMARAVRL